MTCMIVCLISIIVITISVIIIIIIIIIISSSSSSGSISISISTIITTLAENGAQAEGGRVRHATPLADLRTCDAPGPGHICINSCLCLNIN